MQKRLNFGIHEQVIVKNETIRGILLDINPFQVDGVTVCTLADLNKIAFKVAVNRKNQKSVVLHDGWLEDSLRALYSGTTKLEIVKTKRATGYNVEIQFGGVLQLREGDELEVSINAQNTSFTSLSLGVSNINFETIPASMGGGSVLAKVVAKTMTTGDINLDKELEPNTFKIVLANDYTADYFASAKSKPTNGLTIKDGNTEVKKVTENLCISENLMMFENNPASAVGHLIAYVGKPLRNGRIECKFNTGVDAFAKVLTVSSVIV